MTSRPRITVITVVRNAVTMLQRTVDSVLGQDYPDLEFIVVDGGSTDGTAEIVKAHADRLHWWVSEPDRGIYDAMNKGLKHATGEWVSFMNAGDLFASPTVLTDIFSGDTSEAAVIYGDSYAGYAHGKVFRPAAAPEHMVKGMAFCHQAGFVRRNLIAAEGFDLSYPIGADFHELYRLYAAGHTFHKVDIPVAVFDASGVSNMNMLQSAREHFRTVRQYHRLTPCERFYHYRFICWVALVSTGYRILPEGLVRGLRAWRWNAAEPGTAEGEGLPVEQVRSEAS